MFGFITVSAEDLDQSEKDRYRAVYCGLCHTLGNRLGQWPRLALSHDLTFLSLVLMSLYEPQEETGRQACILHPAKKHDYVYSDCVDYAADMTVALMYYKCADDWRDDRNLRGRAMMALLEGALRRVQQRWPRQTATMERNLCAIAELEKPGCDQPDEAARLFGEIMAEVFVREEDTWSEGLRSFGFELGRFVYMMDAACDREQDRKAGSYNPFLAHEHTPEQMRELLGTYMGAAAARFERLPLVQDDHLLRSVLYAGAWRRFNATYHAEGDADDR